MVRDGEVTQVGWAADGNPVLVLFGNEDASSAVRAMRASYRLKTGERPAGSPGGAYDGTFGADWEYVEGLGDLDACNGRVGTFIVDGEVRTTCAYFLTDTFPFIPRCTVNTPDPSFGAPRPQNPPQTYLLGSAPKNSSDSPSCSTSTTCGIPRASAKAFQRASVSVSVARSFADCRRASSARGRPSTTARSSSVCGRPALSSSSSATSRNSASQAMRRRGPKFMPVA